MNSLVQTHHSQILDPSPEPHSSSTTSRPLLHQSGPHEGLPGAPSTQASHSTPRYQDGRGSAITGPPGSDGRAQEEDGNDGIMVAGPATAPPGPSSVLPPMYAARLPLHHHTFYQMMMAASVLRLPGVMARALMGGGLSTPLPSTAPTDLTKAGPMATTSLARLYQNGQSFHKSSEPAPTDYSGAEDTDGDGGVGEVQGRDSRGTEHQDCDGAEANTEHDLATDPGAGAGGHHQSELVNDRPHTTRHTLNDNSTIKTARPISPSTTTHASVESFPSTSSASAKSQGMDCTASMIKTRCLDPLRCLYPPQEVPSTDAMDESRDAPLVKHQVFRPTPTRAAVSQQEQHMIASLAQRHEQQHRQLVLSIPAPARGSVHRPHPYMRETVAPPTVHPIVLQHGASYRDVYRHSAIAQDGMLFAAATDRALRQAAAEGHGLVPPRAEGEGGEGEHQEGENKSSGECRAAGALLDIAACDGPVFFERVLNKAFAGNCLEEIDSDMEINVDELDSADDSSGHTTTGSRHGRVSTTGTAPNTLDERMETSTIAVKQASGSQPRLLHTLSSTYHCVYCNHTFKSHYCYQKHMRRHINPITVEVGPRCLTPSPATPTKTSKEIEAGGRGPDPSPQDLHGSCTDLPTTSPKMDCNTPTANIDQLTNDSGRDDKQATIHSATTNRAILPGTSGSSALLLVPSIKSDCRQKSLQQPTLALASASLRGPTPLSPRLPSPLPVKASLDLNVQYFPCKTCGSKFPSYYFVHKHRRLCHGEENAGGSGLDTHCSGNSSHSGGNSNHSVSNNNPGSGNSNHINDNVADINPVSGNVKHSDEVTMHSTTTTTQACKRESHVSRVGDAEPFFMVNNESKALIPTESRAVSPPLEAHTSKEGEHTGVVTPLLHNNECKDNNDATSENRSSKEEELPSIHEGECGESPVNSISMEMGGASGTLMEEEYRHSHQGETTSASSNGPEDAPINYSTLQTAGE